MEYYFTQYDMKNPAYVNPVVRFHTFNPTKPSHTYKGVEAVAKWKVRLRDKPLTPYEWDMRRLELTLVSDTSEIKPGTYREWLDAVSRANKGQSI